MDKKNLPIEIYRHPIEAYDDDVCKRSEVRLMIVIDLKYTLICSTNDKNIEMTGIFTENQLLANIIAEHIHNDIYLLKLKEKHKAELIDSDILINSMLENKSQDSIPLRYKKTQF